MNIVIRLEIKRNSMVYILMGVSGSGKSLIGGMLADKLDLPYFDADDFHPASNVRKMSSGQPLNDDDRRPWLVSLAEHIRKWNEKKGAVLACSALKKTYRDMLRGENPQNVQFIFLKGPKSLIAERMAKREGHYMPEELLDSQFEALEEPESAVTISIDQSPESVLKEILENIEQGTKNID